MILNDFHYSRPKSLPEALELLGRSGPTVLAGGQSLLPMMKAGKVIPSAVLDIGAIPVLRHIQPQSQTVRIGAMVCHRELHDSPVLRSLVPMLAHVAGQIADPQVRHRGTVGGSLAFADPAADLPNVLMVLDAAVTLESPGGSRQLTVADFYSGAGTALRPHELLTEVLVPVAGQRWSYHKFHREALDWSLVAVAAVRDGNEQVRLGLANVAPAPHRAHDTERAVAAGADAAAAAAVCINDSDPLPIDQRASDDYRRYLARVLTARALTDLGV